ncbi:MAG: hypothetical protein QNK85_07935 [Crocinitomicaceae bacterium]
MKTLLLTLLLVPMISIGQNTYKSTHHFLEWNFGFAYIEDIPFPLPGTSVLFGGTHINENNFIFEYEVGLALPSIVTGKLGIGRRFKSTEVIVGVRPFPFNIYLQSSFANKQKGYWISSIEFNPLHNTETKFSFASTAILNFGYRWNLIKNKNSSNIWNRWSKLEVTN